MEYIDLVRKAASYIMTRIDKIPDTAIVLGSGLGNFAENLEEKIEMAYPEIPNFPVSTVVGHAGKLVYGKINNKGLLCFSGRFHYYEGYSMKDTAFYVRVLKFLGVKKLIITNAAGGINEEYIPGELMLISDHIKFFDDSPLRGENYDIFGPRFNDMSDCYSKNLRNLSKSVSKKLEIDIKEGIYAFMPGPSYETPAEIKMLRILGADAVGMSTVGEAIAASHCNIETLAISCITNMAAGILKKPLSHEEVFETAKATEDKFTKLIKGILSEI